MQSQNRQNESADNGFHQIFVQWDRGDTPCDVMTFRRRTYPVSCEWFMTMDIDGEQDSRNHQDAIHYTVRLRSGEVIACWSAQPTTCTYLLTGPLQKLLSRPIDRDPLLYEIGGIARDPRYPDMEFLNIILTAGVCRLVQECGLRGVVMMVNLETENYLERHQLCKERLGNPALTGGQLGPRNAWLPTYAVPLRLLARRQDYFFISYLLDMSRDIAQVGRPGLVH